MTDLTPRQREILTAICQTDMLIGNPAFTRDADPMAFTLYDDLSLDSLDVVQLGLEIEDAFGIDDIPDAEIDQLKTIADVVALVERMTAQPGGIPFGSIVGGGLS